MRADLVSGAVTFAWALAVLIGRAGELYSVDRDNRSLREAERAMGVCFPATTVHYITGDFTQRLDLPLLDGVVMANSLHYVRQKDPVLQSVRSYLRPGGLMILVEYNADHGNMWVPHPLSYGTWEVWATKNGLAQTRLMDTVPSRFFGELY